jgi:hypothetical protein
MFAPTTISRAFWQGLALACAITGSVAVSRAAFAGECPVPVCNGMNQVLGATDECAVQGNGTGPASRQLQDEVGGVAPADLSPDRAASRCPPPRLAAEYVMKQIADLLRRVWQSSQPASHTQVAVMVENRDRSSMADFVRILQAYDHGYGRS